MQQPWNPWDGWQNANAIFYVLFLGLMFTAPFWMLGLWKVYTAWQRRGVLQKREQVKEAKRKKREERKSRKKRHR